MTMWTDISPYFSLTLFSKILQTSLIDLSVTVSRKVRYGGLVPSFYYSWLRDTTRGALWTWDSREDAHEELWEGPPRQRQCAPRSSLHWLLLNSLAVWLGLSKNKENIRKVEDKTWPKDMINGHTSKLVSVAVEQMCCIVGVSTSPRKDLPTIDTCFMAPITIL